jgi:hypothetical protein
MYDALALPMPTPRADCAAGYVTSPGISRGWSAADWDRAKTTARYLLPIAGPGTDPAGDAVRARNNAPAGFPSRVGFALDVEAGVAQSLHDSGYVAAWCDRMRLAGAVPVVYTSAAYAHLFAGVALLWVADWTNAPHLPPGAAACQYASPVTNPALDVDLSVVADATPLWDTRPAPPPSDMRQYVAVIACPTGGYWQVDSTGEVFSFGGAGYHGGANGQHLNAPIVGGSAAPDGNGYYLQGADGGLFAFGSAHFAGHGPA